MNRFLKLLALIGGILAIPVAVVTLLDYWNRPRSALDATVTYGHYSHPPGMEAVSQAWPYLISEDIIRVVLDSMQLFESLSGRDRNLVPFGMSRWLSSTLSERFTAGDLRSEAAFGGFWRAIVRNSGSRTLSDVQITFPFARLTCTTEPLGSCAGADSAYHIGPMRPRDVVVLTAWTISAPADWQLDEVVLTHSEGMGRVRQDLPIGGFWIWLSRQWVMLLLIGWFVVTILSAILGEYLRSASIRQAPGPTATNRQPTQEAREDQVVHQDATGS